MVQSVTIIFLAKFEHIIDERVGEQGQIHGHQLRTGKQGRECNCPQLKRFFSHFSTRADGQTNGPTDGRTVKASYRVACPQLKRKRKEEEVVSFMKKGGGRDTE